jgi:hypothetical protein
MTSLDAAAILNADDRKTKTITVPEWGGDVIVRELTGDERDSYEAAMTVQKGDRLEPNPIGTRARLVVRSLVGEDGARLFADNQAGALGQKSGGVLDRLWDEIAALSGMTPTAIADAEGNSETVPSDGSTSSEPTPPESL